MKRHSYLDYCAVSSEVTFKIKDVASIIFLVYSRMHERERAMTNEYEQFQ